MAKPDVLKSFNRLGGWYKLLAGFLLFAIGGGIIYWQNLRQEERLRTRLLKDQEMLGRQLNPLVEDLSSKVARLLPPEAGAYRGDFFAPAYETRALAKLQGLYVRVDLSAAGQRQTLDKAAIKQHSDAVTGCLGLDTVLYGQVLHDAEVLAPAFHDEIVNALDRTRLRALEKDLEVRANRDLVQLASHLRPDFLIAVLEDGAAKPPMRRVLLWDLRSEQLVARAQTPGDGTSIVPARYIGPHRFPHSAHVDITAQNTAADCAIADAIRIPANQPEPAQPAAAPAQAPAAGSAQP